MPTEINQSMYDSIMVLKLIRDNMDQEIKGKFVSLDRSRQLEAIPSEVNDL